MKVNKLDEGVGDTFGLVRNKCPDFGRGDRYQSTIELLAIYGARSRRTMKRNTTMHVDLSRVLDGLPAMVWTAVPDGRIDFVNQRWSDYTGLGLDDAEGWKWQSVIKTDDLAGLLERWRSILASGQPDEMEARIRRFDGQYRWFLVQTNPIRDDGGQIIKWCGVSIDVDDRKRGEDDLRTSERDARRILDGMPGLVAIFAPGGELEGVNRQVLEYYGMTFEELKNWGTSDAVHPEDLPRCVEVFANAIASGEPFELECRARRFDGVYRWFQSRGYPFRAAAGASSAGTICLSTSMSASRRGAPAAQRGVSCQRRERQSDRHFFLGFCDGRFHLVKGTLSHLRI